MSDTYLHQLKHRMKSYKWGWWDRLKQCDPDYKGHDDYKISAGRRRKIYGKRANKSFRLAWRKGLHTGEYETLPYKPRDIGWDLW